jgi:uncharacterized PurR-regulated membrane protein YhhQ (DUF165 family)
MTSTTRFAGAAALAAYAGSIAAANWLTNRYGMVPVAPGLLTTAGTYAAGAALLARDVVQDALGRWWVLAGITAGAAITGFTSPSLALASTAAFLVAETADMAVYTPLRSRGWARAVLASNVVGAVLDTLVFLWLAGFPLSSATVGGQLVGKLAWATALPVAVVMLARRVGRRAVPRNAVGT